MDGRSDEKVLDATPTFVTDEQTRPRYDVTMAKIFGYFKGVAERVAEIWHIRKSLAR